MEKKSILYQINLLNKLLVRNFLIDDKNNIISGITPTQMQIIEYILEKSDKDIYQKDLEDVLNLRRATVSGVLKTMEKNELIKRIEHGDDARTKKIVLNDKTYQLFLNGKKKIKSIEKVLLNNITKEDLSVVYRVLNSMNENIINMNKK